MAAILIDYIWPFNLAELPAHILGESNFNNGREIFIFKDGKQILYKGFDSQWKNDGEVVFWGPGSQKMSKYLVFFKFWAKISKK